eukprot:4673125-Amphidinium_carterae.6
MDPSAAMGREEALAKSAECASQQTGHRVPAAKQGDALDASTLQDKNLDQKAKVWCPGYWREAKDRKWCLPGPILCWQCRHQLTIARVQPNNRWYALPAAC